MQLQFDGALTNAKEWEFFQLITRAALSSPQKLFPKSPAFAKYNEREQEKWRRLAATKRVLRELVNACMYHKVWQADPASKTIMVSGNHLMTALDSDQTLACPFDHHLINVGLEPGPQSASTSLQILRSTIQKRHEGDAYEVAHNVVLFIYFRLVVQVASTELVSGTDRTSTVIQIFSQLKTSDEEAIDTGVPSPAQTNQCRAQVSPEITTGSAFMAMATSDEGIYSVVPPLVHTKQREKQPAPDIPSMPKTPPNAAQLILPKTQTSTAVILSPTHSRGAANRLTLSHGNSCLGISTSPSDPCEVGFESKMYCTFLGAESTRVLRIGTWTPYKEFMDQLLADPMIPDGEVIRTVQVSWLAYRGGSFKPTWL